MSILLPFPSGCVVGRLIRREKRFFVHVLIDGKPDVAHTNNTGSMIGLLRPGAPVLLSPAQNPERKLRWTLELVWCGDPAAYPRGGFWAGVNTSTPNRMLEAAFRAGKLPWAEGYTSFAREKVRGESRLDGLLEGPGMPRLWVECKNVTMSEDDVALFPDAVSERGLKHLGTLKGIVARRGAGSHVLLHTAARCLLLRACGHDRSGVCRGAAGCRGARRGGVSAPCRFDGGRDWVGSRVFVYGLRLLCNT